MDTAPLAYTGEPREHTRGMGRNRGHPSNITSPLYTPRGEPASSLDGDGHNQSPPPRDRQTTAIERGGDQQTPDRYGLSAPYTKAPHKTDPHMTLKILSINAKELNTPTKRRLLLRDLKTKLADIALVQETHIPKATSIKLGDRIYDTTYEARALRKQAGVAILLHKGCPFTVTHKQIDPEGRFIAISGTHYNTKLHIVNLYAPNNPDRAYWDTIASLLTTLQGGILVVGGDLNAVPCPAIDRSSKPGTQRSQEINSITWSDHADVAITLRNIQYHNNWTWRLNTNLLTDEAILTTTRQKITDYFSTNDTEDINQTTLWAAHKSMLRGHLIQAATHKK
ncbi:Hypothetical predicted protein [Pelobates cultripes]|uniref:exodeoxyribonuclease III n=1 Tax=Pelobates cultripes TaxID=61616 RepID=A0AAD1W8S4_PELCU|nr:Hypothetical predicted protein [Pelobates cultripes]